MIYNFSPFTPFLLLTIAIFQAQAFTDVSMLKCPSQFNITSSNVTSDTTAAALGSFIYAAFQGQTSKSRVQSIVTTGNTDDLGTYVKQLMIPYIIVAVIFFVLFIIVVIFCLFDKSCPPCESLRRNLVEKPYSKTQIRVVMVFSLIFSLGVLVVCLISFSFIPAMKTNLNLTKCSVYVVLDSALNGDGTWGGFVNLRNQIGNITNLLTSAITKISTYFPGEDWLINDMSTMKTNNIQIYTDNQNAQEVTPNPDTTASAANAGQSTPMVDSVFIKTGLGPNGTYNTMVDDIDRGLRITQKLSLQAYSIYQSAQLLTQSNSIIQATSAASQSTMLMYINQLTNINLQFNTFSSTYFTSYFSSGLSIFQGIFGFALAASLLMLLGIVSTHVFDILTCRRMVHLGWAIYGISYIGIIIVTFTALSLGSIGYGFCNYFSAMLTVQTSYDLLGQSYSQNAFKRVDVCVFGDGNSLEKFSLAKQMQTVTDVFSNIETLYDYMNTQSSNYIDLAISPGKVTGWISAIDNYRLGVYIDSQPAQTTNDNPNYAINQLNLYSNTGGGLTTGSKDRWVWDASNCTNTAQITYHASTIAAGTSFSSSNVTCISFNEKIASGYPTSWSTSDFMMRYSSLRLSYTDAYNMIIKYGATLISFRDSRLNLFQGMEDSLNSLYTQNINFNTNINSYRSRVDQFYAAVSTLSNLVTNPLNGLLVSSNCHSLADEMRFTYNVFCVNFMAQIVKLAVCSLVLMIVMLAGVIAGCRFGMIYAEIQKLQRVNMPEEQFHSEKDMQLDYGYGNDMSSTSSHSEEQAQEKGGINKK